MMRFAATLAVVALAGAPAYADKAKDRAAAEYAAGQKLFKAKAYVQAAERFKAAFAADGDPVYLFNVATALRLANQCGESRDYYKRFLSVAPDAPNQDKIKKSLAEVEACAAKESTTGTPIEKPTGEKPTGEKPTGEKPTGEKPTGERPTAMPSGDGATVERPLATGSSSRASSGGHARIGWIALVGGAVIGGGAGIYFVTRVGAAERDREALCPATTCDAWTPDLAAQETDLDARGARASKLALASFAIGGAAIATGLVLIVTGKRSAERVVITPGPGGAVVTTGFRF